MARTASVVLVLIAAAVAGCLAPPEDAGADAGSYRARGFDGATWPDLHGATVVVLAYSSYATAFEEHARAFHNLTNGTAVLVTEDDSGRVLQRAVQERGDPTFDVVYGVDNVLAARAIEAGVFAPYEPVLKDRIGPGLAFLPAWEATPVTHGYISVNVDPRANLTVDSLDDVRAHADRFVTEDPRTSTPGLGFLLATVATYGDSADADGSTYLDYWNDLFEGGVLVAPDWTVAYVGHFTGGYGQFEEGARVDRPLVTSYTTSPAYEMYYGYDTLNGNVLAPKSTFHQIQTMGIAAGAPHRVAAEAWIEFALTDAFQASVAAGEAIYPVVPGVGVADVYGGRDPAPGTFEDAGLTHGEIGANVARWLREWTDAYERARA